MSAKSLFFAVASTAAVVSAQGTCGQDLLVDDFSAIRPATIFGELKQVNLLGGDYGAAGAEWETLPAEGRQRIVAGRAEIGNPEPWATLNQPLSFNYWFTKFEEVACFDLSKYSAIQFDLVAPAGSNMNFTMTQRSANCSERLADSVYHPLTKYITPNGERQTVTLPLADYAVNLAGNPFDFVHLKDWTIVNMAPADAVFYMSNLMLKGGPIGCVAPTTTAATTATTTGLSTGTVSTATRTATATPNQKSGATQTLTGMSVFAAVLALFV